MNYKRLGHCAVKLNDRVAFVFGGGDSLSCEESFEANGQWMKRPAMNEKRKFFFPILT